MRLGKHVGICTALLAAWNGLVTADYAPTPPVTYLPGSYTPTPMVPTVPLWPTAPLLDAGLDDSFPDPSCFLSPDPDCFFAGGPRRRRHRRPGDTNPPDGTNAAPPNNTPPPTNPPPPEMPPNIGGVPTSGPWMPAGQVWSMFREMMNMNFTFEDAMDFLPPYARDYMIMMAHKAGENWEANLETMMNILGRFQADWDRYSEYLQRAREEQQRREDDLNYDPEQNFEPPKPFEPGPPMDPPDDSPDLPDEDDIAFQPPTGHPWGPEDTDAGPVPTYTPPTTWPVDAGSAPVI